MQAEAKPRRVAKVSPKTDASAREACLVPVAYARERGCVGAFSVIRHALSRALSDTQCKEGHLIKKTQTSSRGLADVLRPEA